MIARRTAAFRSSSGPSAPAGASVSASSLARINSPTVPPDRAPDWHSMLSSASSGGDRREEPCGDVGREQSPALREDDAFPLVDEHARGTQGVDLGVGS